MATSTKLIRELRRQGYLVTITGNTHLKITHPTRKGMVFTGSSPSDRYAKKNLAGDLKRAFGKPQE